jgi:hypothetical protein
MHMHTDLLFRNVNHAFAHLWYRLPLAGRRLKPDIAIGSHPLTVLDYAYAALVPLGIKIMRKHYVNALVLEVLQVVKLHPGRLMLCLGIYIRNPDK